MSDIKPRIDEQGEPVCERGCPRYNCPLEDPGHACIPMLRQQRDEVRRAYCEVRGITLKPPKTEREIALMVYGLPVADRLYPNKTKQAPDCYAVPLPSGVLVSAAKYLPVPFFVGLFPQGPMGEVVRVWSVANLERVFGPVTEPPSVSADIYTFFREGGRMADVMRVATVAEIVAEITVEDGFVRAPIGDNVE